MFLVRSVLKYGWEIDAVIKKPTTEVLNVVIKLTLVKNQVTRKEKEKCPTSDYCLVLI